MPRRSRMKNQCLLKRGVHLDLASLQHKLVDSRPAAIALKQNTLLEAGSTHRLFRDSPGRRVVRGMPDPSKWAQP